MRIKDINIDGFGVHANNTFKDLSPGLNIIYGRNEDGKTTLKNFINTIFFGFKPRNDIRRHEPLNGGNHGGTLTVVTKDGKIALTRSLQGNKSNSKPKITSIDGGVPSLEKLLGGISDKVYENIFSFGLEELNKLSNLTSKEVMDYIYTAGIGLSNSSLKKTKKKLQEEMDDIWKARSKKGLNKEYDNLKKILAEKLQAQQQGEMYTELLEKMEELNNKGRSLEGKKKERKNKLLELQYLSKGLPVYKELLSIEEKLSQCKLEGSFSLEDKSELLSLNSRYEEILEESSRLKERLKILKEQLNNITLNNKLLQIEHKIIELYKEMPLHKQGLKYYEDDRIRLERINASVDKSNNKLGGLLTKDITDITIPLGFEEQMRDSYQVYTQKKGELEILERELHNFYLEQNELEAEKNYVGETTHEKELELLLEAKGNFIKKAKGNSISLVLLLMSLASIILIGWLGYPDWIIAILALSAIPLMFFYFATNFVIPKIQLRKLHRVLQQNGINKKVDIANIDLLIKQAEQQISARNDWFKNIERLNIRKKQKQETINRIKKYMEELNFEKEVLFKQIGFKKDITQDLAITVFKTIEEIKDLMDERVKLLGKIEKEKVKREEFTRSSQEVFKQLGYTEFQRDFQGTVTQLSIVVRQLEEEKDRALKLKKLNEEYGIAEKELNELRIKAERVSEKINCLLSKGKVKNLAHYLQCYSIYENGVALSMQKEKCLTKLESIFPDFKVVEDCDDITELHIQQEITQLEGQIKELHTLIEENTLEKGRLSKEIEKIEQSNGIEEIIYEEMAIKDKIKKDVSQWCTNKLALVMLDKAIKEYEEKYQPDVFKRAERYFSYMTQGRYKRIKLKEESKDIVVVNSVDKEISSQQLSRGTQEQLYICVRLGLMEEFSVKKGDLPALFDDVFVNFDEERTHRALETLLDFSQHNQVIFFTCHKRIVDILSKLGNNTINIINLC